MSKDLSNYRKSYEKQELLESNCPENPLELFQKWFLNADASDTVEETNAVSLSTIGKDGYPKSRIVLLKKYSQEGFIFYTNYNSEKGKAIQENNQVCLSFFWPALEQQIIIKGKAEKLSENLSNGYFESRPTVINGNGEFSRDFTYIDNVIQANLLVLLAQQFGDNSISITTN